MAIKSNLKNLTHRVTLYVDGELNPREEMELLQEIQENPEYSQILSKEQNFKEFIKSKIQRKPVSPTLIQSIKDKISSSNL